MKASRILTVILSLCAIGLSVTAQTKSDEVQTVIPGVSDITVSWDGKPTIVPIRANNNYTVTSNSDWLKSNIIENGKRIAIYGDTTVLNTPRSATLTIQSADGSMVRTIQVQQEEEKSYETIIDKITSPTYAEASSNNGSNNVDKLFDGNLQSYWSTSYSNVSESNPAVLTINFKGTETIDYMVYTPRSGSNVGTWVDYTVKVIDHGKEIINSYSVIANSTPDTIRWEQGITPNQIIITITKGYSNYASGAELSFYEKSKHAEDLAIFGNKVYSKLRDGVTQADIDALQNPFCKLLARGLYNGTYDTTYRYGSYPCRLHYNVLSDEWNAPGKSYSQIDNPTGINFRTGDKKAVFVSGIPSDLTAQMCITAWYVGKDGQSFDGGNPHQVYYTLHNGLNVIEYNYEWDGLAYLIYYAGTRQRYEEGVSNIEVHIVNGNINGILTGDKTNEEMHELCKKAAESGNTCIDVVGNKVQAVWTSAGMRDYCVARDGTSYGYRQYINLVDSLVAWEHRKLGLEKYNRIPDNHTFAYTNYTYYMFQGGLGVSFHHDQEKRVLSCRNMMLNDYDAIWGFSHEWGHQHQMHPYLAWGGCSEVTNNIFSYYNCQKLGFVNNYSKNFALMFWNNNFNSISGYSKGTAVSRLRHEAYIAATENSGLYTFCPELRELILAEGDGIISKYEDNPSRSVNIYEVDLGVNLSPFVILDNYATIVLNYPDFYPDLYESLRQQNNLPNGSTIEKSDGFDKYELISAAQNNNKNGLYRVLEERFPNSCWVTENYLSKGSMSWTDNSCPAVFCFIRKASRLYGYNLYDFFERAGFLRIGAYRHNDYGVKFELRTQKMLDEFKADMKALEDDGTLKPMTESMLHDMFYVRNYNESTTDKIFPLPDIPN